MEKLMEEPSQGEAGLYPRKENTEETKEGGKKGERSYFLDFSTVLRRFQPNDGQSLSPGDPSEEASILQVWSGLVPRHTQSHHLGASAGWTAEHRGWSAGRSCSPK